VLVVDCSHLSFNKEADLAAIDEKISAML
jgi:hypothetical protein